MCNLDQGRKLLTETIQQLHQRGWCEGTGGNFSVVISKSPLRLLMAPSGVDKGKVLANELIEVNEEGAVVQGGGQASAETMMHLMLAKQANAGCILHTHSLAGTLLSKHHNGEFSIRIEGWEMMKGLKGIDTHEAAINIPIIKNNQNILQLSDNAKQIIRKAPYGFLVEGHGLYSWGNDIAEAKRHVEIHEFLLELTWHERLLAKTLQ